MKGRLREQALFFRLNTHKKIIQRVTFLAIYYQKLLDVMYINNF